MVKEPSSKKVPSPSYGRKIAHGLPVPQVTNFRETERFVSTYRKVQCFRIRSVSDRVVVGHNYFSGKRRPTTGLYNLTSSSVLLSKTERSVER